MVKNLIKTCAIWSKSGALERVWTLYQPCRWFSITLSKISIFAKTTFWNILTSLSEQVTQKIPEILNSPRIQSSKIFKIRLHKNYYCLRNLFHHTYAIRLTPTASGLENFYDVTLIIQHWLLSRLLQTFVIVQMSLQK